MSESAAAAGAGCAAAEDAGDSEAAPPEGYALC